MAVTENRVADFRNEESHDEVISEHVPVSKEGLRYYEATPENNAHDKDVDAVENHFKSFFHSYKSFL